MQIKKKSLIVALVSGLVVALVLVLTLIGYVICIELKAEESKRSYQDILRKISPGTSRAKDVRAGSGAS